MVSRKQIRTISVQLGAGLIQDGFILYIALDLCIFAALFGSGMFCRFLTKQKQRT